MPRFFARWPIGHRLAVSVAFCSTVLVGSLVAMGETPPGNPKNDVPPQDVFAAIEAGDLEVGIVPRDERRLTIQLKNKTDRPLTIQMPPALAAAPILAQQPFGGLFNGGGGFQNQNQAGRGQQAPQQLGLPGGQGNNGGNRGLFNIPAGRAIKIKADCVCLEFGKPTPDTRYQYELKPLAEVCDKPELVAVLQSLGNEQVDQRVAQAAAWHLTNDLSWDKLVGLVERQIGGVKEMQFQTSEVAAAKAIIDRLQKPTQSDHPTGRNSLSQTVTPLR